MMNGHRYAPQAYPPVVGYTHRHHAGGWGKACPHTFRYGLTIVAPPPCPGCVAEGEGALILSKSKCGSFEFLLFKGKEVVVCTKCWRYGKPGQNHECGGDGGPHPDDEYLERMLDVVGIAVCPACKGDCSIWPEPKPCGTCGGLGREIAEPACTHPRISGIGVVRRPCPDCGKGVF